MLRPLIAFLVTSALLVGGTLAAGRWLLRPGVENHMVGEVIAQKLALAGAIDKPKILVVGGSGAWFGINAELIEKAAGRPTINLANHVGVGPAYHIYTARKVAKPGDLVILALEYVSITPFYDFHPLLLRQVLFYDPGYLLSYPGRLGSVLFGWSLPEYVSAAFEPMPALQWPYDGIPTAHGGIDWSKEYKYPPEVRANVAGLGPIPMQLPSPSVGLDSIKNFIAYCNANNIEMVFTWPNTVRHPAYATEPFQKHFADLTRYYESLGLTVIGKPEGAFFALEETLDTPNHPDSAGAFRRTQLLIGSLRTAGVLPK